MALATPKLRQRPPGSARELLPHLPEFLAQYRARGEAAVAEPFTGITVDGSVMPGLFAIEKTGVSTQPITDAAQAFLASLASGQRTRVLFPIDGDAWRRWSNIHPFTMRHGLCLDEMTPGQRDRALALLRQPSARAGIRPRATSCGSTTSSCI